MPTEDYNLDEWRTFVLREIIKKNEGTFTDYLWKCLKTHFELGNDTQKAYYLYTECVLNGLKYEGLVRIENRGIQVTRRGIEVAKKRNGYRSYVDTIRRNERLQEIKNYIVTISGGVTILSILISSINIFVGWTDIYIPILTTIVSYFITISFRRIYRKNN